jgi:hypothetical protein
MRRSTFFAIIFAFGILVGDARLSRVGGGGPGRVGGETSHNFRGGVGFNFRF